MGFKETLDYLYGLLPMYQRVGQSAFKKDLTNTLWLCAKLGNPQEKFRSVHIAGTNGKGSSAHALAAVFQAAGYKTGLYTSPHLKRFTERIRINGQEASEEFVTGFVEKMKVEIEAIQPSFFELTVAMAFEYFATENVDVAVVETGLGGRFDSTNIIEPVVSLITSISFDHEEMLGHTLEEIAFEKAGIIKQNVPVVIGEQNDKTAPVFNEKALSVNAPIYFAQESYRCRQVNTNGLLAEYAVDSLKSEPFLKPLKSDLTGKYQERNIPGILMTLDLLGKQGFATSEEQVRYGFGHVNASTGLKGRWQVLGQQPLVVCDTGHNEDGVRQVMAQLKALPHRQLFIVWGMVKDKAVDKIFGLFPKEAKYYFCEATIPRALDAEIMQKHAGQIGLRSTVIKDVNSALGKAMEEAGPDDIVFVGGSNFVVAELESI